MANTLIILQCGIFIGVTFDFTDFPVCQGNDQACYQ